MAEPAAKADHATENAPIKEDGESYSGSTLAVTETEDGTIIQYIPEKRACGPKHPPTFRAGWTHAI